MVRLGSRSVRVWVRRRVGVGSFPLNGKVGGSLRCVEVPEVGDGELELVQLAHLDIHPSVLADDGVPLASLMPSNGEFDDPNATEQLAELPPTGWRLVKERAANGHPIEPGGTYAAPHPDHDGKWAILDLGQRNGRWDFSANPGPLRVYPGRAARRKNLRLTWSTGVIEVKAGAEPVLSIDLQNVGNDDWINVRDDSTHIFGWLLNPEGERIVDSAWMSYGHGPSLPTLTPGATVTLPVTVKTPRFAALPPGSYGLEALLAALNLRSNRGSLRLS